MESRDLSLFIGQTEMGSQIESALGNHRLIIKETTTAGVEYLVDETEPNCVVTDHNPPAQDCFELLDTVAPEMPVIVAPTDGSSSLATRALRAGAKTYLDPTTLENGAAAIAAEIVGVEHPAETSHDEAKARIEEFSSLVSHELRSPIQKATSGIDLAKTQCESRYLDEVSETLDRMDELIDNLLGLMDTEGNTIDMEPVDLSAVIEAAWPDDTAATLDVDTELPSIEAERSRLQQLFENLFRNAVEHGGEAITVRVGVIEPADGSTSSTESIGLYIDDDGPGIEPDRRETVFEYGYTNSENGTGLGLAIVSEIVDTFGWEITVTESARGGARFEIYQLNMI
ncbi:sensor histidine kinase [Halohasta litchfieldiae]|nr:hybrid sensor histidine kinase/response regulator [Halohasta litchfieldiae]